MGNKTRQFDDGETIFREGDAGDAMFLISSGQVSLSKESRRGPVEIEVLDTGAYFGEIGILNGGQRTMTATAVGTLVVEMVDPDAIRKKVTKKPGTALSTVVKSATPANSDEPTGNTPIPTVSEGWFSRLFGLRDRNSPHIEVRVVPLMGENGDRHARNVMDALSDQDGLNVRIVSKDGPFTQKALNKKVMAACARDAAKLLQKSGGDILVWGDVSADTKVLHLHFSSAVPTDSDMPGSFCGFDILPVPVDIPDDWRAFLYAVLLSATATPKPEKDRIITANIEAALEEGAPTAQKPPREFTSVNRAHLFTCLGHTLAAAGYRLDEPELSQLAIETYRRAVDTASEEEASVHSGIARKNLASLLSHQAERTNDVAGFREAADIMGAAIEALPKRLLPREWAAAQNRLGLIFYRLDLADATADARLLTSAISAFHAAIQIYTRVDAPDHWANVMHNYARTAQVLGGQLRDPKILQKSVNACRNVLEVRRRNKAPQHWAMTQNTLGSALFLMGKITNRRDHLESALDAFTAAHEFYAANGAERMARVIARNISHVESLLSDLYQSEDHRAEWLRDDPSIDPDDADWWRENVVDDPPQQALG